MPKSLKEILPNPEDVLALEPEELAGVVLQMWNSDPSEPKQNRNNFTSTHNVLGYPQEYHESLRRALMEAWMWTEREGLIAPIPGQDEWYYVTQQGKKIASTDDLASYLKAAMLPKRLLHPVIAQKVWATFLRGDYDTAVFQAFKEVEVQVRSAGGFSSQDLGVNLMRSAFAVPNERTNSGPLTDSNANTSEQEALRNLFTGAIGLYKNPHSHRNVQIDATEAVEMIMLASHLLKIVDIRSSGS